MYFQAGSMVIKVGGGPAFRALEFDPKYRPHAKPVSKNGSSQSAEILQAALMADVAPYLNCRSGILSQIDLET